MLNIAEELKTIYKNDMLPYVSENAPKDLEIYFPALNLYILTDQIVDDSFELNEKLCSEEDLIFGACEASQIKFTVADVVEDLTGLEFTINQIVNGAYTVPLGGYKVDSCKKQDDLRFKDIIAYDTLKSTDVNVADWYNGLFPFGTETYTLSQFRASLLAHLGITEDTSNLPLPNDNMIVEKTIEPTQISGRTVMEACEEINGCFGRMGRNGKFKHIVLQPGYGLYPSETLYPSDDLFPVDENDTSYVHESIIDETIGRPMYKEVKFEEYAVKEITKLIIRSEENDVGAIVTGDKGPYLDTLTGTSLSSNKAEDDGKAEIIKIEGASYQKQTTTGKNLVEGSAIPVSKSSKWSENGWQGSFSVFDDTSFKLVANNGWYVTKYQLGTQYAGKQVTISFYAKLLSDETTSTSINEIAIANATGTNPYFTHYPVNEAGVEYPSLPTKDTWLYHRCTVTLNTDGQLGFGCHCTPEGQGLKTTWLIKDIQIELGSTATPYEPFVPNSPSPEYPSQIESAKDFDVVAENEDATQSNKLTISSELRSLPNGVADTIELGADSTLKKIQRIGKVILNGSESGWDMTSITYREFRVNIDNQKRQSFGSGYCSHYKTTTVRYTDKSIYYGISGVQVFICDTAFDNLTSFKASLQSNPITVYYELATPIETIIDIPTKLTSYKGATNVYSTSNPQVSLTAKLYGNTNNAYIIEGNFLVFGKSASELEQIARNAFGNMAKRPYRPYEAQSIGLPYVEVGDVLKFDLDDPVTGYVFQRTLTGIQALQDEYTASGNEEREQNFGLNTEIIQLQGRYNKIKKDVDGISMEVGNLEARTNTKFEQTDEKINLEAQRAIGAEGTLSGQIEVMAGQVVLKVDANGNLATVELDADPSEGTSIKLKADNMIFEGLVTANNNFKILADGSMEAKNGKFSGTLSGSTINGGVINGTRIVSSGNGVLEINGAEISGYNSSGGLVLWINANGTINAGTLTALDMHCTNLACGKLNGYTPITSGNIGEQWAYGAQVAISAGELSNALSTNQIYASDTGYGNINFLGFDNAAGVNWVQANFAPKTSSDVRLKHDISSLDSIPNELFMSLKPKQFRFKTDKNGKGICFGLIAQELENAFSSYGLNPYDYDIIELDDVRKYTDDGMYVDGETHRINYINFIPWMVKIIQEQNDKIISLEDTAQEQNERISTLEEKLYNY